MRNKAATYAYALLLITFGSLIPIVVGYFVWLQFLELVPMPWEWQYSVVIAMKCLFMIFLAFVLIVSCIFPYVIINAYFKKNIKHKLRT
jgi:cytochrome c oxidase assembly factor CtaG